MLSLTGCRSIQLRPQPLITSFGNQKINGAVPDQITFANSSHADAAVLIDCMSKTSKRIAAACTEISGKLSLLLDPGMNADCTFSPLKTKKNTCKWVSAGFFCPVSKGYWIVLITPSVIEVCKHLGLMDFVFRCRHEMRDNEREHLVSFLYSLLIILC